jgi:Rieske Fe-S protein
MERQEGKQCASLGLCKQCAGRISRRQAMVNVAISGVGLSWMPGVLLGQKDPAAAPQRRVLACDCHSSEFDPREAGKVVDGPAARPLPPLPLKLLNGNLAVAKPFAVAIRFDE